MKYMLAALVFWAAMVLSIAGYAQTTIAVDINKATLTWQWVKGAPPTDGTPDVFNVKCGPSSKNYTVVAAVTYPSMSAPILSVVKGSGTYFCVVTAANKFGESGPSNEVTFDAGAIASSPTNLTVQSN